LHKTGGKMEETEYGNIEMNKIMIGLVTWIENFIYVSK